jgi:DNA-binding HxlR family transcriptional regulator
MDYYIKHKLYIFKSQVDGIKQAGHTHLVRTYGQYCAIAKALDVVGDRWNLLIIRELFLRSACRYTDLREGLPGIATNLLTDRLRDLEEAGLVRREDAPPPVATTLFRLTERGAALAPVLRALGAWGASLMEKPDRGDEFRTHWLAMPVSMYLKDHKPDGPPLAIQIATADQEAVIEVADGAVRVRPGKEPRPAATLSGSPHVLHGVLSGRIPLTAAKSRGLRVEGDLSALRRLGVGHKE